MQPTYRVFSVAAVEIRPATRAGWLGHVKRDIVPTLGDTPAAALSREQIRRWGEGIAKRSGYSANRAFEVLRRCYSWGVEHDIEGGRAWAARDEGPPRDCPTFGICDARDEAQRAIWAAEAAVRKVDLYQRLRAYAYVCEAAGY